MVCSIGYLMSVPAHANRPRVPDFATEIGDADLVQCKPTLDTWRDSEQTGPGYCSKIALGFRQPRL